MNFKFYKHFKNRPSSKRSRMSQVNAKFCTAFCKYAECSNNFCGFAHDVQEFRGSFGEIADLSIGDKLKYIQTHQVSVYLHNLLGLQIPSDILFEMNLAHGNAFTAFCKHPICTKGLCTFAHTFDQYRAPENIETFGDKVEHIIQNNVPVYMHILQREGVPVEVIEMFNCVDAPIPEWELDLMAELDGELFLLEQEAFLVPDVAFSDDLWIVG